MTKRLFIAADISEHAREVAARHIDRLKSSFESKGISWVKPENLHITIKFLGDTEENKISEISDILAANVPEFSIFSLSVNAFQAFAKRVLVIGMENLDREIFRLEKRLDTEFAKYGHESESRRFRPHLTIARLRGEANELTAEHIRTQIEPVAFEVRDIVLYESELRPGGSVYTKLESFQLRSC